MVDRLVWMDYFRSFYWNNIKKQFEENANAGVSWMITVINQFILWPILVMKLTDMQYLTYIMSILPYVFTVIAQDLVTLELPKLIYMSPLGNKEHKAYIEKKIKAKIIFPNMIAVVIMMVMLLTQQAKLPFVFPFLVLNFLNSIGTIFDGKYVAILKGHSNLNIWTTLQTVYGMVMVMVCSWRLALNNDDNIWWWLIGWAILTVCVQLPIAIKVLSYKQGVIEKLLDFENVFVVKSKR